MALDEFAAETEDGTTGNYGVQDQRLAMQWIKANVKAFGGDESHITMFGESAGGVSVCYHLTSPASAGLFTSALAESSLCSNTVFFADKAVARNFGSKFAAHIGCANATGVASCLRDMDADKVLNVSPVVVRGSRQRGPLIQLAAVST